MRWGSYLGHASLDPLSSSVISSVIKGGKVTVKLPLQISEDETQFGTRGQGGTFQPTNLQGDDVDGMSHMKHKRSLWYSKALCLLLRLSPFPARYHIMSTSMHLFPDKLYRELDSFSTNKVIQFWFLTNLPYSLNLFKIEYNPIPGNIEEIWQMWILLAHRCCCSLHQE